jgi:hypothetical protein
VFKDGFSRGFDEKFCQAKTPEASPCTAYLPAPCFKWELEECSEISSRVGFILGDGRGVLLDLFCGKVEKGMEAPEVPTVLEAFQFLPAVRTESRSVLEEEIQEIALRKNAKPMSTKYLL